MAVNRTRCGTLSCEPSPVFPGPPQLKQPLRTSQTAPREPCRSTYQLRPTHSHQAPAHLALAFAEPRRYRIASKIEAGNGATKPTPEGATHSRRSLKQERRRLPKTSMRTGSRMSQSSSSSGRTPEPSPPTSVSEHGVYQRGFIRLHRVLTTATTNVGSSRGSCERILGPSTPAVRFVGCSWELCTGNGTRRVSVYWVFWRWKAGKSGRRGGS